MDPPEESPAQKWVGDVRVLLDDEDTRLLEGLMSHEKLSRSEIFRRALRQYAKSLNVVSASSAA